MEKRQIINKVIHVRKELVRILESIPEDQWDKAYLGKWSLRDVAAHVVGWDFENAKSVKEILEGTLPSCFTYWDDNWVTYNDGLVGRYKNGGKKELLSAMEHSHDSYIETLENVPVEEFDKDVGLRWQEFTITPAVNADYEAKDELLHVKQIVRWLRSMR